MTDFRESRCRQFDHGECTRGGYCNFMHLYKVPFELERRLFGNRATRKVSRSPPPRRERRQDYHPYERRDRDRGGYGRRDSPSPPRYHRSSPSHSYERREGDRSHSREKDRYRAPSPVHRSSRDRERASPASP